MGSGVVWVGSMGDGGHEMKCDSVMYQIKIYIYICSWYVWMVTMMMKLLRCKKTKITWVPKNKNKKVRGLIEGTHYLY